MIEKLIDYDSPNHLDIIIFGIVWTFIVIFGEQNNEMLKQKM